MSYLNESARRLDLSRRRVAAISFLANIATDAEIEESNGLTEIRLDCLQKTHVLKDFQEHKRHRQRRLAELHDYYESQSGDRKNVKDHIDESDAGPRSGKTSVSPADISKVPIVVNSPSDNQELNNLPRKLTFGQSPNKLFVEDSNGDFPASNFENGDPNKSGLSSSGCIEVGGVPLDLSPSPSPREGAPPPLKLGSLHKRSHMSSISSSGDAIATFESGDNLLHLDLSKKVSIAQHQTSSSHHHQGEPPKSAPIPVTQYPTAKTEGKISGFFPSSEMKNKDNSTENLRSTVTRRKLHYIQSTDGGIPSGSQGGFTGNRSSAFMNSSSESIIGQLGLSKTKERFRKISGNLSENSASSLKEIRYFKADEDRSAVSEERLVLVSTDRKVPFVVCSVLPFQKSSSRNRGDHHHHHHRKRTRTNSENNNRTISMNENFDPLELIGVGPFPYLDEQETSYNHLLRPTPLMEAPAPAVDKKIVSKRERNLTVDIRTLAKKDSNQENPKVPTIMSNYSPNELDGWLVAGKHSTFLPFQSSITSVIEYVKPSDLKKELNAKFKERFPNLQITLSKLRSLKRDMKRIVLNECELDLLTLSYSYVYFEMLILKAVITKANRKHVAGSCVLLAAKMNDVKRQSISALIEKIESIFKLNRKELLSSEFAVLVSLEFGLHVPSWQVFPHFQRLLYDS